MLKRYAAPQQIRWVGKAWEIRHALRQELKRRGSDARVAELAAVRSSVAASRRVCVIDILDRSSIRPVTTGCSCRTN